MREIWEINSLVLKAIEITASNKLDADERVTINYLTAIVRRLLVLARKRCDWGHDTHCPATMEPYSEEPCNCGQRQLRGFLDMIEKGGSFETNAKTKTTSSDGKRIGMENPNARSKGKEIAGYKSDQDTNQNVS